MRKIKKAYHFPNMGITVYALDIEKADEIAKKFEKRVYQENRDWTEEVKRHPNIVQKVVQKIMQQPCSICGYIEERGLQSKIYKR